MDLPVVYVAKMNLASAAEMTDVRIKIVRIINAAVIKT